MIVGIVAIFGGPMVVISLIKLYRRNLSRFLESCGCAVNRPMRLTRRMGGIFTFAPKRPKGELFLIDPAELLNFAQEKRRGFGRILLAVLALLLGAACGVALTHWFLKRSAPAASAPAVLPQSSPGAPSKPAVRPQLKEKKSHVDPVA